MFRKPCHASRSVSHRLDALTVTLTIVFCIQKITSLKVPPTCELGMESYYKLVLTMLAIIMFCIGVYTMESVLNDCLAQFSSKYVLKEEQRQAVLGLLEQEDIVVVLPTGFGKSLI